MSDTPWYQRCRLEMLPDQGGRLHLVGRTAQAVYLALRLHADTITGIAYPSVDTIAAGLGITRRPVQSALGELTRNGLIDIELAGGGWGRTTHYKITPPNSAHSSALTDQKGAVPSAVIDQNSAPTSAVLNGKGAVSCTKGRSVVRETALLQAPEEHIRVKKRLHACSKLRAALRKAGVHESAFDHLAKLDNLSPADVEAIHQRAKAKNPKNVAGLVVRMLKDGERAEDGDPDTLSPDMFSDENLPTSEEVGAMLGGYTKTDADNARQSVDDMPEPRPHELTEAMAWRTITPDAHFVSHAKQACPELFSSKGFWLGGGLFEAERVVAVTYRWAVENTVAGERFAQNYAAKAAEVGS